MAATDPTPNPTPSPPTVGVDPVHCTVCDAGDPTTLTPSRRGFIAGAAALTGAAGLAGVLGGTLSGPLGRMDPLRASASATPLRAGAGKLIVVFLRGGTDGLTAVVPAGDPDYFAARPTIAVPAEATLPLDGIFGLHPAMAPLHEIWQDGRLSIITAVGNPARSRSHFDAQDLLEQGSVTRRSDAAGWLTRHLATSSSTAPHGGLFRAVAVSNTVPGSLRGAGALAIASVGGFGLGGLTGASSGWTGMLDRMHWGRLPVETTGQRTVQAVTAVRGVAAPATASPYADAVALLASDLGVEVVTIDTGGWDTHNNMGTHASGQMRNLLGALSQNLARLQADLDSRGLSNVTTVVMSEFGRRVAENGSGGTDHGAANVMFVMGGAARNRQVLGTWPGLAPANLDRGDVAITTDVRDVLWELVRDVLGHPTPEAVFGSHLHTPVGATR